MESSISTAPEPPSRGHPLLWHRLLRCCAVGLFVVYSGWQVYWLGLGDIPPALFLALTGWPAPTTGGTRAILLLWRGQWSASLAANPMAIAIVLVLAATLSVLVLQVLRRQRLRLPKIIVGAWIVVLGLAWMIQVCRAV